MKLTASDHERVAFRLTMLAVDELRNTDALTVAEVAGGMPAVADIDEEDDEAIRELLTEMADTLEDAVVET